MNDTTIPAQTLQSARSQRGDTLEDILGDGMHLVVFLRHAGCTFCKETLADLRQQRPAIEARGVGIVLVHLGTEEEAAGFFARYGLGDVPRVSDPDRALYRAFELRRVRVAELLHPRVWLRGIEATLRGHHVQGVPVGDPMQMPGAFLMHGPRIVRAFRHESPADRPDYRELASCAIGA